MKVICQKSKEISLIFLQNYIEINNWVAGMPTLPDIAQISFSLNWIAKSTG